MLWPPWSFQPCSLVVLPQSQTPKRAPSGETLPDSIIQKTPQPLPLHPLMVQLLDLLALGFPPPLLSPQDRHFNMVEYHVPVSAGGVANIFDLLEGSKAAFNIRHFSVSQTTLEEVRN